MRNGKTTNATEAEGWQYWFKAPKIFSYLEFFLDLFPAICLCLSAIDELPLVLINPLIASIALETSQSIWTANQSTGIDMGATLALNGF